MADDEPDLIVQAARDALLDLAASISQEGHWASWMDDLPFALWQIEPNTPYGSIVITERQSLLLKLLSEEAGGWFIWRDGGRFIPMAEWLEILASKKA